MKLVGVRECRWVQRMREVSWRQMFGWPKEEKKNLPIGISNTECKYHTAEEKVILISSRVQINPDRPHTLRIQIVVKAKLFLSDLTLWDRVQLELKLSCINSAAN